MIRTLSATTYLKIYYSLDGGVNYSQITDEAGSAKTFDFSAQTFGGFFPQNSFNEDVNLKLELYGAIAGELDVLSIRGDVIVNRRDMIACVINANETVQGLLSGVQDTGATIRAAINSAVDQGYSCAIQDARGDWYEVLIKAPTPQERTTVETLSNAGRNAFSVITLNLVVINKLSSTGARLAWSPG